MPKGGARPGAGRPIGMNAIKAENARAYFQLRLETELEPILTKQIEQAKAGDDKARSDLYSRAYGKPQENVDITSKGEKVAQVNYQAPQIPQAPQVVVITPPSTDVDHDTDKAYSQTAPRIPGTA